MPFAPTADEQGQQLLGHVPCHQHAAEPLDVPDQVGVAGHGPAEERLEDGARRCRVVAHRGLAGEQHGRVVRPEPAGPQVDDAVGDVQHPRVDVEHVRRDGDARLGTGQGDHGPDPAGRRRPGRVADGGLAGGRVHPGDRGPHAVGDGLGLLLDPAGRVLGPQPGRRVVHQPGSAGVVPPGGAAERVDQTAGVGDVGVPVRRRGGGRAVAVRRGVGFVVACPIVTGRTPSEPVRPVVTLGGRGVLRRSSDHGGQVAGRAARLQVVVDVPLGRQAGQLHHADLGRRAGQVAGHLPAVVAADVVVVDQHGHPPAPQPFGVHSLPLAGPLARAGGDQPAVDQGVDGLLPLDQVDPLVGVGVVQLRLAVQHPLDVAQVEDPPAAAVGPALAEVLRVVTHLLVQQLALGRDVVVRPDLPAAVPVGTLVAVAVAVRVGRWAGEQVGHLQAEAGDDVCRRTSGVALEQGPAAVAAGDAQGRGLVVVGRAAGHPAALAGGAVVGQQLEQAADGVGVNHGTLPR